MKLIHCADLHLDARMTAHLSKEQARLRKAELLQTFDRMVQYADQNGVAAILIAGDLFDTKKVSASARNVVDQAIAAHPQIAFYYIRGNHDTQGCLQAHENLHLFGETWTSVVLNPAGNKKIVLTAAELLEENQGALYDTLLLSPDCFNIVMLHGQESGSKAKDAAERIDLRRLQNKGIDYLALGHIHAYKKERLDARGIYCYSGCLEGRGFDECGAHGFVLLDIDEERLQMTHTFVPFAQRTLYTVAVDVTDCMHAPEMLARARTALEKEEAKESDMVKLVLTGALDVDCEKDLPYMQRQLAQQYAVVKIQDDTALKIDAMAYAAEQSLKGEFVRTVMAADDLSEEDRAAIVRYGLRALAGEDIIE